MAAAQLQKKPQQQKPQAKEGFEMRIEKGYPPNIDAIKMVFPVTENTIYAYGDIIYSPQGDDIRPDIIFHENVHRKQQAGNPEAWWNKYLVDIQFRFDQELEAYYEQWQWVQKHTNAKIGKRALEDFARQMALPLYDFGIEAHQAETALRKYGKAD